jgi:hypothetical protein
MNVIEADVGMRPELEAKIEAFLLFRNGQRRGVFRRVAGMRFSLFEIINPIILPGNERRFQIGLSVRRIKI